MTSINLVELLSHCVSLAREAGAEIVRVAEAGPLTAQGKDRHGQQTQSQVTAADVAAGSDAVTPADLAAQALIQGSLLHLYPSLNVIGEEDIPSDQFRVSKTTRGDLFAGERGRVAGWAATVLESRVTVYVDPLDATQEFILGNKYCAMCLIGIAVDDEAVGGVMFQPFQGPGRLLWALRDFAAADDHPDPLVNILSRPPVSRPAGGSILATTRLHASAEVEDGLAKLRPLVGQVQRVGGAGYKALLLLEGTADIYFYPTPGTKKWDTCAPEAIVRYFGGAMVDRYGQALGYARSRGEVRNAKGILAVRQESQLTPILALLAPESHL